MSLGDLGNLEWVRSSRQDDIDFLNQKGITHQQLHERLQAIIQNAKEVMAQMPNEYNSIGVLQKKMPVVEVEGVNYKVISLSNRKMQEDACPICEYTIKSPSNYTIKNMTKNIDLLASEIALHLLDKHRLFVQVAQYKLDPEKACKVLNFEK